MAPLYSQGDVLLASLVFSDGLSTKRRPVLVVTDFGDSDLLIVPITSHAPRVADTPISEWRSAGLKLPSCIRTEKFATIQKSLVIPPSASKVARAASKTWSAAFGFSAEM